MTIDDHGRCACCSAQHGLGDAADVAGGVTTGYEAAKTSSISTSIMAGVAVWAATRFLEHLFFGSKR